MNDARAAADPAWAPLLGAAYALFTVAAVLFLAAGFTQVEALLEALGSVGPASDRLGRLTALVLVAGASMVLGTRLARAQMSGIAANDIGSRVGAVIVTALVLMAPPVQWTLFGRPQPLSAHEHAAASAPAEAQPADGPAEQESSSSEHDHGDH